MEIDGVPVSRWERRKRALRWPFIMHDFLRRGATWSEAWRFTHWCIWFDVKQGRSDE